VTGNEAQALAIQIAELRATIVTRLDNLVADNARGEVVHADHEKRLRLLEASGSEARGVWKLLTAGGVVGALIVGAAAIVLRSLGA
jgi:hypothetical protein